MFCTELMLCVRQHHFYEDKAFDWKMAAADEDCRSQGLYPHCRGVIWELVADSCQRAQEAASWTAALVDGQAEKVSIVASPLFV